VHVGREHEDGLIQAWIGPPPVLAATESGVMVDLSDMQGRRDGSGTALTASSPI
jgi:DNA gyrase subunit A